MSTCSGCGQTIAFRYIGGRVIPLGCGCGGESAPSREKESFCRRTECPECGAGVFFLRHNGGSVWLDDLGWPWPRHGCFADEPATRDFAAGFAELPNARTGQLARFISVEWRPAIREWLIAFESASGERMNWIAGERKSEPVLARLGLLDVKAKAFTLPGQRPFPLKGPCARCKYCEEWLDEPALADHVAVRHAMWKCPHCGMTVEARFRREHEVTFQCGRRS